MDQNQNTGGNANSTFRTCLTCGKKDEAMDSCEICKPKGMTGWVCPVCGRGNSPFSSTCPCKGFSTYPTFNTPIVGDMPDLNQKPTIIS
jgi:hypothetical protein